MKFEESVEVQVVTGIRTAATEDERKEGCREEECKSPSRRYAMCDVRRFVRQCMAVSRACSRERKDTRGRVWERDLEKDFCRWQGDCYWIVSTRRTDQGQRTSVQAILSHSFAFVYHGRQDRTPFRYHVKHQSTQLPSYTING